MALGQRTNPFKRGDLVFIDGGPKVGYIGYIEKGVAVVIDPQPFPYHASVRRITEENIVDTTPVLRSCMTLLNRELTVEELLMAHPDFLAVYAEKTE